MSQTTFEATTAGDRVLIALGGEIDLSDTGELDRRIVDAVDNEVTSVVLDLSGVTYIDSAGLRLVASLTTRLRRAQVGLVIVAPGGSPARRLIELTGMEALAPLVDSVPT